MTRRELGLPIDQAVLATGHQPTLWHPGILAKYVAVDAVLRTGESSASGLNVIVDQDVVDCGSFDVPMRRNDGSLAARRIELAPMPSDAGVPAGWHPAFVPRSPRIEAVAELPQLPDAAIRLQDALKRHATAPNAAVQLAGALSDLMSVCAGVEAMPTIMASHLMRTTLASTLIEEMLTNPHRCAEAYNRAVVKFPESRLTELSIRDDYVELPLWRVRVDDRGTAQRVRAYDADLESAGTTGPLLLPRALFMTAIIRLAVADLFVHGLGGRLYDRAMELWIRDWLGVDVSPMAVASATVRLPLMHAHELAEVRGGRLSLAQGRMRRLTHDPESEFKSQSDRPGPIKRELLHLIKRFPRRSHERRTAFIAMHQRLEEMRLSRAKAIEHARSEIARLARLAGDAAIAERRDWAFALYPEAALRELVERIRSS